MTTLVAQVRAEVEQRLGFFPRLLQPAVATPVVLEGLWQSMRSCYLDNPLPSELKEKLLLVLARQATVPYFVSFHACTLSAMGVSTAEIHELLRIRVVPPDLEAAEVTARLARRSARQGPRSEIEEDLIAASRICFTGGRLADPLHAQLKRVLGEEAHVHWGSLLIYAKAAHQWLDIQRETAMVVDEKIRSRFENLLRQEPRLVDLLRQFPAGRRRTDELFFDLADNIREVFWVVSADLTEMIYVSPSYERVWGRSCESAYADARSWLEAVVPEDREAILQAALGEPFTEHIQAQYRIRKPNGEVRWIRANANRVFDQSGQVLRLAGVAQDITEERLATEALRDSEERLRHAIDLSPFPAMIHAEDDEIILLSKSWTVLSGYSRADIPTLSEWMRQAHGQSQLLSVEVIDSLHAGGQRVNWGEFLVRTRSGEERTWDFSSVPLGRLADGRRLVLTMAADISERLVAEGRSRQLAAIVESTDDAIISTDVGGRVMSWNAAAERLYGYRAEEVLGRDVVAATVPPERMGEIAAMTERLARGEAVLGMETVRRRKDGESVDVSLTISLVRTKDGETTGASIIARDISERRQAERLIREKNRELETLLHVTSHDLREPLRAIEQFSRLVCDRYREQIDDKGRDFLARVVRAAARMRTLLDDVLSLARARRIPAPDTVVTGEELVRGVCDRLGERIEETHATVHVSDGLPRVRVDRRWAAEALFNLVANALKYTRNGAPPDIEIRGYHPSPGEAGDAGFVVADRGPGVPERFAERIFDLFQRTVGCEVEGTGAGLAIVRAVAERHGGAAWVRPREGGGSEFIITFADPGEPAARGMVST
jgi:PAS domain S-box-containing protein